MFLILLLFVSSSVALVPLVFLIYLKLTKADCQSRRVLNRKTVIVTGANSGIGLETARELAARNARVILACRSLTRGQKAARNIIRTTGNRDVAVKQLDLSSLQSVREFASDVLENETRIDVLINNAGAIYDGHWLSVDGLELTMAVNHFGPFLLTSLLLPLLKKCAPARIVVVSSELYQFGRADFEAEKPYMFQGVLNYCASKLANVVFALELAKRLTGSGITVNCLHPGCVRTGLSRRMSPFWKTAAAVLGPLLLTPAEGAQTSIYLAVSEDVDDVTGKYFRNCEETGLRGKALDPHVAARIWNDSLKIIGITDEDILCC